MKPLPVHLVPVVPCLLHVALSEKKSLHPLSSRPLVLETLPWKLFKVYIFAFIIYEAVFLFPSFSGGHIETSSNSGPIVC